MRIARPLADTTSMGRKFVPGQNWRDEKHVGKIVFQICDLSHYRQT